jgi:hypothetical protein
MLFSDMQISERRFLDWVAENNCMWCVVSGSECFMLFLLLLFYILY